MLLSGCAHQVEYKPANPQNTKNSYSQEMTSGQYAKERNCSNAEYKPIKFDRSTADYESVGAFQINSSFYTYKQPCKGLEEAYNFCKTTNRSIDNCVAGLMYSSGYSSSDPNDEIKRVNLEKATSYSKVVNAQVTNLSTGATTAGAQLGSIVSQANYIDSSNWQNYSATTQVGVGLLGAVVGGMLDSPSATKYKVTYFLQMPNGDIKQVEKIQTSEPHIPSGVCVGFREPNILEVVNQSKCDSVKK